MLLVEDDIDLAGITKMSLEMRGYEVVLAHTVEQTVAAAKAHKVDVIVLDYFLEAGRTGLDALRELKQIPAVQGVPVFFMSGLLDTDIRNMLEAEGALGFLTKPLRFDTITTLLREVTHPTEAAQHESP
jgi:DNA-binding response OmpR family regulator